MHSPFLQQRILQYLSCQWCVTKWMFEKAGAGVWPSQPRPWPSRQISNTAWKWRIGMDGAEYREYRERRGSRDICKSLKRLTTAAATAYSLLSLFGQKIGNTHTHTYTHVEGDFFNCSAQISVLKRKTLFNQRGSFVHQEYHGRESLIGCPTFFILVLKIGRNS